MLFPDAADGVERPRIGVVEQTVDLPARRPGRDQNDAVEDQPPGHDQTQPRSRLRPISDDRMRRNDLDSRAAHGAPAPDVTDVVCTPGRTSRTFSKTIFSLSSTRISWRPTVVSTLPPGSTWTPSRNTDARLGRSTRR